MLFRKSTDDELHVNQLYLAWRKFDIFEYLTTYDLKKDIIFNRNDSNELKYSQFCCMLVKDEQ